MTKIIKLTESQLRDVVQKVINEQSAGVSVDQIYKEFVAGGTGAKPTSHTVMASAINKIPDYKTLLAFNKKFIQEKPGGFISLVKALRGWLKVGEENIFKNIQAKLKTLGVNLIINNPSGVFKPEDIAIGSTKVTQKPDPNKPDPNKLKYRTCNGFPIKYGCNQTEVGKLQKCLGIELDYSFGPDTLKAILDKTPDPKMRAANQKQITEIGLSEGAYKLLIAKCVRKQKPKVDPNKIVPPAPEPIDTRTPAPQNLSSKSLVAPTSSLGNLEGAIRNRLQKDLATLAANAPQDITQERKDYIIAHINDRGFDQKYVGDNLTPTEQLWVDRYMQQKYGSVVDKNKTRGGDTQIRRFDTPQG